MTFTDRRLGVSGSVAFKIPCRVATTANITLSGLQTIDGITLVADDRVLVKDQTDGTENGIYVADTSSWLRSVDFDGPRDCVQGTAVLVVEGTVSGAFVFELTTASPVIDTTDLTFTPLNGYDTADRSKLVNGTTYYVRTDGADTHTGLANTAGAAFLTLQGAIDHISAKVDLRGEQVVLQVAAGTYAGFTVNGSFVGANASDMFRIVGDEVTPANVVIQGTSADAIRIADAAHVSLRGLTITTTGSGVGLEVLSYSYVEHQNLRFGNCADEMILVASGGFVSATGNTTIAGNADSFLHVTNRGKVDFEGRTVTFSGTPAFTTYVVGINDASVSFASGTVVGNKTGRIVVHIGGVLNLASMTGKLLGTNHPYAVAAGGCLVMQSTQDTIYVRSDGSDNNDGLTNDSTGAFLTIAAALAWLRARPYDQDNSRTPIIQVGSGTWSVPVVLKDIPNTDLVYMYGDETTPANVVLSAAGDTCFLADHLSTSWHIRGFKMTGGYGIRAARGSRVYFQKCAFHTITTAQIYSDRSASVENTDAYSITGAAANHVFCTAGGVVNIAGATVTVSGTPAFTIFARIDQGGIAVLQPTWSGSATGTRYDVRTNGVIDSNGGTLPGDAGGSTATGGQYA